MRQFTWYTKVSVDGIICIEYEEIIGFVERHLKGEGTIEPEITPGYLFDMTGNTSLLEKPPNQFHGVVS
jgi:hypothetical protein